MRLLVAILLLAVIGAAAFLVVRTFAPAAPVYGEGSATPAPVEREWSPDDMRRDPEGYLTWADEQIQSQIRRREEALAKLGERRNELVEKVRLVEQGSALAREYDATIARMDARAESLRSDVAALVQLRERIALDLDSVRLNRGSTELEDLSRTADEIAHFSRILGQLGEPLRERQIKAERQAAIARMLAEPSADPDGLHQAAQAEIAADELARAGRAEEGIAALERARDAYESLMPGYREATLEEAVAARNAVVAARALIRELPADATRSQRDEIMKRELRLDPRRGWREPGAEGRPKPGSMPDLVGRALAAEGAGSDALDEKRYGHALALLEAARRHYRDASALRSELDAVEASRERVRTALKLVEDAFPTANRPAAYERGRQRLAEADRAAEEGDLETAKQRLAEAAEQFEAALAEARQLSALAEAVQTWAEAAAAADEGLLSRYAGSALEAARKQAADGQARAAEGRVEEATGLLKAATAQLAEATVRAKESEKAARVAPLVERLKEAIAKKEKFEAEGLLGQVEAAAPDDPRAAALRGEVEVLPWPQRTVVDLGGDVRMEFALIPPGDFVMGSPEGEAGRDTDESAHNVKLTRTYYMGVTEVTQAQWKAVMGTTPSNFKGDNLPVEQVSWRDACTFCERLSQGSGATYRLPTEAEWEYACRAGTTDARYGPVDDVAWYGGNSGKSTQPVAGRTPNALGLHDMLGNVFEWCLDWYGPYASNDADLQDPQGARAGSARVVRGGSWGYDQASCRAANRVGYDPARRYVICGFRVVRVP